MKVICINGVVFDDRRTEERRKHKPPLIRWPEVDERRKAERRFDHDEDRRFVFRDEYRAERAAAHWSE